mmetsp:Transcript_11160/g.20281  ORF Transcript_11160/g.20281 Transcript_11160/m.20281 type:complete len:328 (-) Transcript_11160:91-1074(-)
MQWVWEELSFRHHVVRVAHFEAPTTEEVLENGRKVDDEVSIGLDRCEAELGACLWHDTNKAALTFLSRHRKSFSGMRALELGAGAGACGIGLALDGAHAVITDVDALVPLLQVNAKANGFDEDSSIPSSTKGNPPAKAGGGGRADNKKRRGRKKNDDEWDEQTAVEEAVLQAQGDGAEAVSNDGSEAEEEPKPAAVQERKPSAKERRAARQAKRHAASEIAEVLVGSCKVQAADWLAEAACPRLPAASFDVIVVCDCLYENRDSWNALQQVLDAVAAPDSEVLLASAHLRRPFLEAFVEMMVSSTWTQSAREESEHATIITLVKQTS